MSAVELVVTDLDGTFWYHDLEVAPSVVAAVAELERLEVPLLVATGRRLASTRGPLARAALVHVRTELGQEVAARPRWL